MSQKTKYYCSIAGVIAVLVVVSILVQKEENSTGMMFYDESDSDIAEEGFVETEKEDLEPELIYVYLCGAVMQEGVYEVTQGTRIFEVIALAGGLREDASAESVNQASEVTDGQQITIYTKDELQEQMMLQEAANSGLININRASVSELCQLSGVGESRAADIVAYRETNGEFATIEDIMNVAGIKDAIFEKVKDSITVD